MESVPHLTVPLPVPVFNVIKYVALTLLSKYVSEYFSTYCEDLIARRELSSNGYTELGWVLTGRNFKIRKGALKSTLRLTPILLAITAIAVEVALEFATDSTIVTEFKYVKETKRLVSAPETANLAKNNFTVNTAQAAGLLMSRAGRCMDAVALEYYPMIILGNSNLTGLRDTSLTPTCPDNYTLEPLVPPADYITYVMDDKVDETLEKYALSKENNVVDGGVQVNKYSSWKNEGGNRELCGFAPNVTNIGGLYSATIGTTCYCHGFETIGGFEREQCVVGLNDTTSIMLLGEYTPYFNRTSYDVIMIGNSSKVTRNLARYLAIYGYSTYPSRRSAIVEPLLVILASGGVLSGPFYSNELVKFADGQLIRPTVAVWSVVVLLVYIFSVYAMIIVLKLLIRYRIIILPVKKSFSDPRDVASSWISERENLNVCNKDIPGRVYMILEGKEEVHHLAPSRTLEDGSPYTTGAPILGTRKRSKGMLS